jgi:hypothetical protein
VLQPAALTRPQRGAPALPPRGTTARDSRGAFPSHDRLAAVPPQRPQPRDRLAVGLGDRPAASRTLGSPALQAGHGPSAPRRLATWQTLRGAPGETRPAAGPGVRDALDVPRAGLECLFGRGRPTHVRSRALVARLTGSPPCWCRWRARASRGAAGVSRTHGLTRATGVASQHGRRPLAGGRGALSPVVHCRGRNVSTHARLTPKSPARARGEPQPWAEAWRLFARRSMASGVMPVRLERARPQSHCKPF